MDFRNNHLRAICIGVAAAWIAMVVFSLGFVPLRSSHDEFWHLKSGKWMVEQNHYHWPAKDIFTFTAANYNWDNHEWLSQIVMYEIYRWGDERDIGGWRAVILGKTLLLIATYLFLAWFVYRRAGSDGRAVAIAMFLGVLVAAVGRRTFWPRPPIISYLFMAVFLYIMWLHHEGKLKNRHLFILPILMVLWANLHGGFVIGGIIVAAYCGGEIVEWVWLKWRRRGTNESAESAKPISWRHDEKLQLAGWYALIGFLCGVGSLLNPYGARLYLLSKRVMSEKELVSRLSELLPPDLTFTWAFVLLAALFVGGSIALVFFRLRGRRVALPALGETLVALFFLQQASAHVRHLPLFGIAAIPIAALILRELWRLAGRDRAWHLALIGSALVCGLWLIFLPGEGKYALRGRVAGASNFQRNLALLQGTELEPGAYPVEAVDFILSAQLPGRMFNENRIAGYLIWRLSPEHHKVFTDQRFDVFGGDFLIDELSVGNACPWDDGVLKNPDLPPDKWIRLKNWHSVIDRWGINWIFIEHGEKIDEVLREKNSGWALIYYDPQYSIWIKQIPANQPWIERYEAGAIERMRMLSNGK